MTPRRSLTSRRAAFAPLVLLAATALAGCGAGAGTASAGGGSVTSTDEGTAGTAPVSSGVDGTGAVPPFPADTAPVTGEAGAEALVTVSDIRVGRHDGYDRVVLELGGAGTPGWDVRYVDQASSQGSGEPIEVAGDAVLQVTVTGAGYPYATGVEEWAGPDPLPGEGTVAVTEVAWDATFEGTSVAFIGTRAELPFRVYPLADPTRLVVEVVDPS